MENLLSQYSIVKCDNGSERVAATLYESKQQHRLLILVPGSFFAMNAPDPSSELRVNICADFITVKSTLVQASLMNESALKTERSNLLCSICASAS